MASRTKLGCDFRAAFAWFLTLGAVGCGASAPVASAAGGSNEATCKGAKDPLHPLIVEWGATSKIALESVSQRGIAVVAYDGCSLHVLAGCAAHGGYDAKSIEPDRRAVDLTNRDDVLAWMPLALPSVGATLASGKSLHLDYVVVSERSFAGDTVEVSGDCDGATHFVKRIRLGAYTLDARADARASATADIGPLTAGGTHQESDQRAKSAGDPERCASDPKDASCTAPVALELVTLSKTPPRPGSDTMMLRDR